MDDRQHADGAHGLTAQGPHWHCPDPPALPADFVPLRLVLQAGGYTFELTRPDVLAGRHSEADVRLPLPDVSRRHCRLRFAAGGWQVFDLNSLNGIYVNGQRVQGSALRRGDTLRIGGFIFDVDLGEAGRDAGGRPVAGRVLQRIADSLPPRTTEEYRPPRRRAG